MAETAKALYNRWAESGSLRPSLLLTEKSEDMLRLLQDALYDRLIDEVPEIKKTETLHATTFYLRPAELFKYMKRNVNPKITQERFYPHLMSPTSMLLLYNERSRVHITGIERFKSDESTIGVALHHEEFEDAAMNTRQWIQHALKQFGANQSTYDDMAQIPQFEWLVKDSTPHITLVENVDPSIPIPLLYPPTAAWFDGVDAGTATASPTNRQDLFWWHLRGLPGDPMLERRNKKEDA